MKLGWRGTGIYTFVLFTVFAINLNPIETQTYKSNCLLDDRPWIRAAFKYSTYINNNTPEFFHPANVNLSNTTEQNEQNNVYNNVAVYYTNTFISI